MKTLAIDIETSPNAAHVWDLWNQNIGINQLRESTRVICAATQFEGEPVEFFSEWDDGTDEMLLGIWARLDAADVIVHYNGQRFDVPHLNREFLQADFYPPSPYKQVDLYREVKKTFSFPSYKLAYVADALGIGQKVKHEGHELWIKVLAGDADARKRMQVYNEQDTKLLLPLYHHIRPWIPSPSYGAMTGDDVCPACGSADLQREGHAYTSTGKYQRYVCGECGKWSRSTYRTDATKITPVAA